MTNDGDNRMDKASAKSQFKTKLLRPAKPGKNGSWTFLVLPQTASDTLPRRGRTTVKGTINGHPFQATLEPDGQLSHWLKVGEELREASGIQADDLVSMEIAPVRQEPEPNVPADLNEALDASPEVEAAWNDTTTLARLDWIHWIESPKQSKTRKRRINKACDMLASGKKRVCCFDQSGFYSKSLSAPQAID
jgi:hypothetical protein